MKINRIFILISIFIMLADITSCSSRKMSPGEQKEGQKSDKGYIVYINADTPKKTVLYSVDASGKSKKKIYDKNPYGAAGSGSKIAFLALENGKQMLYTVNADGSGLTPVMQNTDIKSGSISLSPDSSKLAFIGKEAGDADFQVYYVERGSDMTPVRITNDKNTKGSPRFSMDGKFVIFDSGTDNNYHIYKHDIGANKDTNLSGATANDISPAVSPDGMRILFLSDEKSKGKYDLYSIGIDGTGRTQLTAGLDIVPCSIKISPSSSMVSFIASDDSGKKSVQIMQMNKSTVMISSDAYLSEWSSDGKILYFASFDPQSRRIVEYDITGKSMKDAFKIQYKPGEDRTGIKFLHFTDKLK